MFFDMYVDDSICIVLLFIVFYISDFFFLFMVFLSFKELDDVFLDDGMFKNFFIFWELDVFCIRFDVCNFYD